MAGDGRLALGALADDGTFECIQTDSGAVRWTLALNSLPNGTLIVAGDLDDNGRDSFLVGLMDGQLLCIRAKDRKGKILWRKEFDSGVANPIIGEGDGDKVAEIIVSTSDGRVRVLRGT